MEIDKQKLLDARQLLQDDLLTYLHGMEDRVLDEVCEIVIKRFEILLKNQ